MPYQIELRFIGDGISAARQEVFERAAERWRRVIVPDQPPQEEQGELIEGLLIKIRAIEMDGPGKKLAQAEPKVLRQANFLPLKGEMFFDQEDLDLLEFGGMLLDTITHEIGHVLGFGTLWSRRGLLSGEGTVNPGFLGPAAMREFASLSGLSAATPVPVENNSLAGSTDCHWREMVLGNELMTSFGSPEPQSLSRLTVASLVDLGYTVDFAAADPFILPTPFALAMMGVHAEEPRRFRCPHCRPA